MEPLLSNQKNYATSFPTVDNKGIEEGDYSRNYARNTITQATIIEGDNRAIIFKDGNTGITGMIIGNLEQQQ